MEMQLASQKHLDYFQGWNDRDRQELLTCRPILYGRRVVAPDKPRVYAFFLPGVETPVGKVTYGDVNIRNQSAEMGYRVQPELRGKGIGTRMLTTFINHIFVTTELNKLYCQTGAFNQASVRLLEKLGFHRDGVLREHHELDGQLWDDYVYSLLRREWHFPEVTD